MVIVMVMGNGNGNVNVNQGSNFKAISVGRHGVVGADIIFMLGGDCNSFNSSSELVAVAAVFKSDGRCL